MKRNVVPAVFQQLLSDGNIAENEIVCTQDGFVMIYRSLSEILARKNVLDFPDADGARLACDKFYDDWFLYAVPSENDYVYSLLKLREQEHDAKSDSPADGDTPGVTISFISFSCDVLLGCLANSTDENRQRLDCEIDRVVVRRGQRHDKYLKMYFVDPKAEGSYLVADLYTRHIVLLSDGKNVNVSECYRELAIKRTARLPRFIESLNQRAGYVVCDNAQIYIQNKEALTEYERAAILATHTGNTSIYSFAAEVEYHARFLTFWAKIKLPLFGKSIYDSAIRADMTIDDKEFVLFAPFYKANSKIVKRQYELHKDKIQTEETK